MQNTWWCSARSHRANSAASVRQPRSRPSPAPAAYAWPYGLFVPAQWVALRVRRFMHEHRVTQDALAAVVLADYHHAQLNPRAVMYGRPLTREQYDRFAMDRRAVPSL